MDSKWYFLFLSLFLVFKMIEAKRFVNSQRALPALSSKFRLSRRPYAINLRENGYTNQKTHCQFKYIFE